MHHMIDRHSMSLSSHNRYHYPIYLVFLLEPGCLLLLNRQALPGIRMYDDHLQYFSHQVMHSMEVRNRPNLRHRNYLLLLLQLLSIQYFQYSQQ